MGNELADFAAKRGAQSTRGGGVPPLAKATYKRLIMDNVITKWQSRWSGRGDCRQSKLFLGGPRPDIFPAISHESNPTVGKIVRFLTGHAHLRRHDAIVKEKTRQPLANIQCRLCRSNEETPFHLVANCDALARNRLEILGHPVIEDF